MRWVYLCPLTTWSGGSLARIRSPPLNMPEGGSPQYSSMTSISVYMDTCVLSRIVDVRLKEATALAYAEIVERGGVQLVTSHKTRTEVLVTANPVRKSLLQFLVALVQKVPLRTLHLSGAIGGAPVGAVPIGGSWTDPLLTQLRRIFDPDDAEHVTLAVHAGCRYFLTLDNATILSRVQGHSERVKALVGALEFVNPEQLATRLQSAPEGTAA